MMMVKFHGPVKTEGAVAVACSDFVSIFLVWSLPMILIVKPVTFSDQFAFGLLENLYDMVEVAHLNLSDICACAKRPL